MFLISESVSVTREQKKRTEGVLTNLRVNTVIYFVSNFSAISARQKGRVSIIITSRNGKLMATTFTPEYCATKIIRFEIAIFVRASSSPVLMVLTVHACRPLAPLPLIDNRCVLRQKQLAISESVCET